MATKERTLDIRVTEVREARDDNTGNTYTMYRVDTHGRDGTFLASTWRRYQEFDALNKQLQLSRATPLSLPPKKRFGAVNIEERRIWLECALRAYGPVAGGKGGLPTALTKFLMVDSVDLSVANPQPSGASNAMIKDTPDQESLDRARAMSTNSLGGSTAHPDMFKADTAKTDELLQADAALIKVIATAEGTVADQWWQKQLQKLAVALLVMALPLRRVQRISGQSISNLFLGACSGLWIAILAPRQDAARRVAAVEVVKIKAKELSTKIRSMLQIGGSSSSASGIRAIATVPENFQSPQPSRQAASPSAGPQASLVAPKHLQDMADGMCEKFLAHMKPDVSAYGTPWEQAKCKDGFTIWSAKIPGMSRRVWKSHHVMKCNASLDEILAQHFNWEKRLMWDTSFACGNALKQYGDVGHNGIDVCIYASKAILTISSREFVDLRTGRPNADGSGFLHTFASIKPDDITEYPQPKKSPVRADTFPGSGIRWSLMPDDGSGQKYYTIEVVAEPDPKGWIPTSVINNAMTITFTDNFNGMMKHFPNLPAA